MAEIMDLEYKTRSGTQSDVLRDTIERICVSRPANYTGQNRTLWASAVSAARGFADAVRYEKKVAQIVLTLASVAAVLVVLRVALVPSLLVLFFWTVSLICEIFNTALEKTLDYSCRNEFHLLVKQGKDYASACTFVSLTFAGLSTLAVLWAYFF